MSFHILLNNSVILHILFPTRFKVSLLQYVRVCNTFLSSNRKVQLIKTVTVWDLGYYKMILHNFFSVMILHFLSWKNASIPKSTYQPHLPKSCSFILDLPRMHFNTIFVSLLWKQRVEKGFFFLFFLFHWKVASFYPVQCNWILLVIGECRMH